MSKYARKKECRCCKKCFDKDMIAKFRICRSCEDHVNVERSGSGLAFVFPDKCPGPTN